MIPATVFSSIDRGGRYAYGNQPTIAHWNLARFAETLLPLLNEDEEAAIAEAQEALTAFGPRFERAYYVGLRRKLGLATAQDGDIELAGAVLKALADHKVDFTLFFRRLADAQAPGEGEAPLRALFSEPEALDTVLQRWRARLAQEPEHAAGRRDAMRAVNPAYIPRNHRVEAMIKSAVERNDFTLMEEMTAVLSRPFDDQPEFETYAEPPQPEERVLATFCGT
jgi:uncharacterized protein YdiU (UPF0061 family)